MDRLLFLSRAMEDKALVESFQRRAKRFLLSTWTDNQVKAGEMLWPSVAHGLEFSQFALFFLTEASFEAVKVPERGLHHELALLQRWQDHPERRADNAVVFIDCIGLTNQQLASVHVLRP